MIYIFHFFIVLFGIIQPQKSYANILHVTQVPAVSSTYDGEDVYLQIHTDKTDGITAVAKISTDGWASHRDIRHSWIDPDTNALIIHLGVFREHTRVEYTVFIEDTKSQRSWYNGPGRNLAFEVKPNPIQTFQEVKQVPEGAYVKSATNIKVKVRISNRINLKPNSVFARITKYKNEKERWSEASIKNIQAARYNEQTKEYVIELGKADDNTKFEYALYAIDINGQELWNNNSGKNYQIIITNKDAVKQHLFDRYQSNPNLKIFKNHSFNEHLNTLKKTLSEPSILMVSPVIGNFELTNPHYKKDSEHGGISLVIESMIKEYPKYLKEKNGKISFLFLWGIGDMPGQHYAEFNLVFKGSTQKVSVNIGKEIGGADIYFVKPPNPYYQLDEKKDRWLGTIAILGKTASALADKILANILHFHDNSNFGAAYSSSLYSVVSITHNSKGSRFKADFPADMDDSLNILDMTKDFYVNFANIDGELSIFKASAEVIKHYNLFSTTAVSPGFAEEIQTSKSELVSLIKKQKGGPPANIDNLESVNFGVDYKPANGIVNGISSITHASNNKFLSPPNGDPKNNISPKVKEKWQTSLNFGAQGFDKIAVATKSKLKALLQENLNLELKPESPIFMIIARMDDIHGQKNVRIFAKTAKHIVDNGGQVIIAGPAPAPGIKMEDYEATKNEIDILISQPQYKNKVATKFDNIQSHLKALLLAGSDFMVITSKFEPCGTTDYEMAQMGGIVLGKRTGGIGKVKSGLYYEWHDTTDVAGEVAKLKKTIDDALILYKNKGALHELISQALTDDYGWIKSIDEYFLTSIANSLYKVVKSTEESTFESPDNNSKFDNILSLNIPNKYIDFYVNTIEDKRYANAYPKIHSEFSKYYRSNRRHR